MFIFLVFSKRTWKESKSAKLVNLINKVIELTNSISIDSVHIKLQEFKARKLKGKRVRECSMMTLRLLLLLYEFLLPPSLHPCNL